MEKRIKSLISLKKTSDFDTIKNLGKKHRASPWLTIGYIKNSKELYRFGLTISKKVGNAVLRNKLKRWSRETLKKSFSELPDKSQSQCLDLNLIFRPLDKNFYKELKHREFIDVLNKAVQNLTNRH